MERSFVSRLWGLAIDIPSTPQARGDYSVRSIYIAKWLWILIFVSKGIFLLHKMLGSLKFLFIPPNVEIVFFELTAVRLVIPLWLRWKNHQWSCYEWAELIVTIGSAILIAPWVKWLQSLPCCRHPRPVLVLYSESEYEQHPMLNKGRHGEH